MKKKGFWAGLLACLAVCLLAGSALGASRAATTASGTLGGTMSWTLSGTTLTVSGTGAMRDFPETPPETADTEEDKALQDWFNARSKAKTVAISEGITSIGSYAFYGCTSISSVTIPSSAGIIDAHAFENCTGLSSLTLPQGVTRVGDSAFAGCTGLSSVQFPLKLAAVGNSAFSNCKGLSSAVFRDGLTSIGDRAFYGAGLRTLQLPNAGTITVGESAFNSTSLGSNQAGVCLPASVASVGEHAFGNCGTSLSIHHFSSTNGSFSDPGIVEHFLQDMGTTENRYCNNYPLNSQRISQFRCLTPTCGRVFTQVDDPGRIPCAYENVKEPATCTEDGYEGSRCKWCHTFNTRTTLPATGHDYRNPHKPGDPDFPYDPDSYDPYDPDDPNNFEYLHCWDEDLSYNGTCTRDGQDVYVKICANCGHKEIVETVNTGKSSHTRPTDDSQIKETIIPPTDCRYNYERKELAYTCTVCKKAVTETVPTGGDYLDPYEPANYFLHDFVEKQYTVNQPATCTKPGHMEYDARCAICGRYFTSVTEDPPALGHLPPENKDEIYEEVTKAASCKEAGEKVTIYQCQRPDCDSTDPKHRVEITEDIPVLPHTPVSVAAVPGTCMKPGMTGGTKCSVCDEILSGCTETKIDPNAHSYKEEDVTGDPKYPSQAATCTEDGFKYVRLVCELCDDVSDEEPKKVTLPSKGQHEDDPDFPEKTERTEPTCGKDGAIKTIHRCKVCGQEYVFKTDPIRATGEHDFGEWVETKAPTDTAAGEETRTCNICGHKETRAFYPVSEVTLHPAPGVLPDGASNKLTTSRETGLLTADLPTPTREGYIFTGWFTEESGGTQVTKSTIFFKDTALYAHWTEEKIYTVTLDANEGTLGDAAASLTTGSDGKLAALPKDPTRDGFLFDGWFTAREGGDRVTTATVFTGDTTIYAHWTKEPEPEKGFTITLDAGGGTLSGSASVKTGDDGKLSALPAAPAREGYDFDGWFTASEGGVAVTTATVFQSDATIYARWSVIDTTTAFAIRIGSMTGGIVSTNTASATRGTEITVLVDPDSGYALDSIRVTASGGTAVTLTKASDAKYTFTMPGSAVDVTATFKSTGSGGSSSGNNSNNNNNSSSGGAVWNPDTNTNPNPEPVPVKKSVPQATASNQIFLDIPVNHWAAGEISWAFQQGYMNGTGGGNFSPDAPITHSQLWTVLTRLLRYANIPESNLLAIRSGLLDGGSPTSPATRQELVTALHRCAYLLGGARTPSISLNTYADAGRVAGYARDAMAWAVTNGIISGTTGGRLNPEGVVSRAQFAVILYRFTYRM